MRGRFGAAFCLLLLLRVAAPGPAAAAELPPRNPHLAASSYPVGHADSAQSDSVPQAGPQGETRTLSPDEIEYASTGPGFFGAFTSGPYPDGRRVLWGNGLDRIVKLDHDSFQILATHPLPGMELYTEQQADESIARFERSNHGPLAILASFREMLKFRNLAGVYTLLDRDNVYYIGDKDGTIRAWGEADPSDPASAIVSKREIRLPPEVSGPLVGMNMSFDGWLLVATEHGYLVAIRRDFGALRSVRLAHADAGTEEEDAEGAEEPDAGGGGWIRNSFAVDESGGVYVASRDHLHKVIWRGDAFSTDAADGAWSARYRNGWGRGTGATPTLMGFGGEDRFVVITDGDVVMNLTLFWRDEIPADWRTLEGAPDRRIAGQLPANMGDPSLAAIQSEQSVVVAGTGAAVVNNMARNVPWYVPGRAVMTVVGALGSHPDYQPFGVQKFVWNPRERRLEAAWVNREVSLPNCVPIVSYGSNRLYAIGARDNRWTLEALDWDTGRSAFHWKIGGQRYNSLFSGVLIDEAGRVHYGGPWGRVRLAPAAASVTAQPAAEPVPVPEPDAKALAYYRSGNVLWWLGQAFGVAFPLVLLATGFSARMRSRAERIGRHWILAVAVYAVFYRVLDWLAARPLGYYGGYLRPHAYGLSNQTFGKWLRDGAIDLGVSTLVGVVLAVGLYAWLERAPRRWWLGATACLIPFLLLVFLIQPLWIAPLYNDFGPMQDAALEAKILGLAERAGIEGSRVFEVAKSVDTNAVNAYVTGFLASKRIVLWDTLLSKLEEPEVLFVMGHEMGHYVLHHVLLGIAFYSLLAGLGLYAIHRLAPLAIQRWRGQMGFARLDDVASLPLLLLLLHLGSFAIMPAALGFSRWMEHEADRFGLELTQDGRAAALAFVKLQQSNLSHPRPGPLFVWWRGSHPPLGARIDFANAYRPWEHSEPLRYGERFR